MLRRAYGTLDRAQWQLQRAFQLAKRWQHTDAIPSKPRLQDPAKEFKLKPVDVSRPSRLYPQARRLRRRVYLHIGPTNSGKSHTALEAFKAAKSGFYAGPLRMLAREIFDRMASEGIPCNLVTGDEVHEVKGAMLNSGTVEMMDTSNEMDVAILDEIQMIEDPDRGWAWTRAFLGVRARELHLCGDPNSEQIITTMCEQTGDELVVRRYERLSPLELEKDDLKQEKSVLASLQPGDCIVCFSKKEVRAWRDKLFKHHGNKRCCSIIYGSLPPETRAEQAMLFNTPGNGVDYLVASDAIGMGLNLAIRRVIFTTLKKFDGRKLSPLSVPQIKQIAGRAGRFVLGGASVGLVNCVEKGDKKIIARALQTQSPKIQEAVCLPPDRTVRSATVGEQHLNGQFSRSIERVFGASIIGKHYRRPNAGNMADVAGLFDRVYGLTFGDRLRLCNAPVPTSIPTVRDAFTRMCKVIGSGWARNILQIFPEMALLGGTSSHTMTLESIHKVITLFLWLSYRFPSNFLDQEGAIELKRLCELRFNEMLASNRSLSAGDKAPRGRSRPGYLKPKGRKFEQGTEPRTHPRT